ncbi:MAG: tRNA pseudouridine(13) synthase TruD [Candidatus Micrarchaeota archaeon]|nr:tRNA pseudouridine(13) synthase TruD [Candidatus Micrarchaeota archaeon]MDE1847529.1 tRNA pseudouridine(13) synthase TruD [Candidatus Micrarchaeota archaeon]MDE1863835.1 tRNA pseudouridine(13) synthase TruD [Candidatus Micrarchaeota archaeon]
MICLSQSKGIGGSIKKSPEDFLVKEIAQCGKVLEPGTKYLASDLGATADPQGKFSAIVLEKRGWDTIRALQTIAKRLGRGVRSIGYAGMKDRMSKSTQLASIFGAQPEALGRISIKDISINGAWKSTNGIGMGDLLGNAFEIVVAGADQDIEKVMRIEEELGGVMPNYFDAQRFGSRLNNFKIGMHILRNELEEAVLEFLTATSNETNQAAVEARRRLAEENDFAAALGYFPGYLKGERTMLYSLSKEPTDFAKAIRAMPRGISIMFIHSVEALVFNRSVEMMAKERNFNAARLRCKNDFYGFPDVSLVGPEGTTPVSALIGYETSEERINSYESQIMNGLGIGRESFRIKSMPELSMRGSFRPVLSTFKNFGASALGDDVKLGFELPAGAYATILISEFTKSGSLDLDLISPSMKEDRKD